ncbi:S8 family serine peptidase [Paucibacter sp. PLA-PC-4]|uniref:S8 family serine peptidase n=1 Tax=Paucibacter sp. PLA-PC-4 TaxID=2993655 RepID=UPI00224B4D29|nr:S8 family serine peptidase [Paucibacter sp. PLA-PC-4]MCX2865766.1 S8 family serine peptidase [Paucibacter sp. PLA-PC-4]
MKAWLPTLALCCWLAGCSSLPLVGPPAAAAAAELARGGEARMQANSERFVVVAVANPLERVPSRAGTSLSSYGGPPRYTQGSRAARTLAAIAHEYNLRETAAWPIPTLGVHCVVFEIAANAEREQIVARLSRDERVRLAQPLQDFSVHATGQSATELVYNDPYLPLQLGFAAMKTARAHRLSTGKSAHIAVIDTGAQTEHPDLRGRIQAVDNLVDADRATFELDRHGTEVVGIIAAAGNNGRGIVGIAPDARISLYKACWYPPAPAAPLARCNSFTLAKALAAVMATDARILNLSLGGPGDPLLAELLTQLIKQDRLVIAAQPPLSRRSGFPANVPGVITVGMAESPGQEAVLRAPGRDVLTLAPGSRYDFASGSSMAAAHVSGLVALLQAIAPGVDRQVVEKILGGGAALPDALLALEALAPRARRVAER